MIPQLSTILLVVLANSLHLERHDWPFTLSIWSNLSSAKQQELLKLRSSTGTSLEDMLKVTKDFPFRSGKVIFMTDPSCYRVFRPLIEPLLTSYYPRGCNPYTIDPPNYRFDPEPNRQININPVDQILLSSTVISTRMRVVRNLADYPFVVAMTKQQRIQVERQLVQKHRQLKGSFAGEYIPVSSLSRLQSSRLQEDHLLFKYRQKEDDFGLAGGLKDWPTGRGIYLAKNRKFMTWVGEEDHFRIVYLEQGADFKGIYSKLTDPVTLFDSSFNFAFDQQLGYLSTCLGKIGSTLTVSILIKLQNLSYEEVQEFARNNQLLIRGTNGTKSPVENKTYTVQNQVRFCHDAKTIIERFIRNAAALAWLDLLKNSE